MFNTTINKSKIYYASAGSGKTHTLVKEFVAILLANPKTDYYRHVLAMTFTNKAADEMKARIFEWLDELGDEKYTESEKIKEFDYLKLNAQIINQRAKAIKTHILHHYSLFSISTIDKFNLRLMKSFAKELNLSLDFDVEINPEQLIKQSIDIMYAEIGNDVDLKDMLLNVALNNLEEEKNWDEQKAMVKNVMNLLKDDHLPKLKELEDKTIKDFTLFRKSITESIRSLENDLKTIGESTLELIVKNGLDKSDFSSGYLFTFYENLVNYKTLPPNTVKALVGNQKWKTDFFEEEKLTIKSKADRANIIQSIFHHLKTSYYSSISTIYKLNFNKKLTKNITSLSVHNKLNLILNKLKKDNNILFLGEFNKIISENLKDQSSAFIYEKLGSRYNHYFIDEFQDTSTIQYNNLIPLLEEVVSKEINTPILLVGDAKQSIYRWRGGNPSLLIDLTKKEDYEVRNLDTNYRSSTGIINFNNEFYTHCADYLTDESYKTLYKDGNRQLAKSKTSGFVQLNLVEKTGNSNEIYEQQTLELILKTITECRENDFELNDITILYRSNKTGAKIANYLTENNVPILSEESLLLDNSNAVRCLIHLLYWLINPDDKKNKALFLLKLNELRPFKTLDLSETIYQTSIEKESFVTDLSKIGYDFKFILDNSYSLYDLIEACIRELQLLSIAPTYLQFFLDFVLEQSFNNAVNLNQILEIWEDKKDKLSIISTNDQKAVRLMSIHKSKGLEFPIVIFPFAHWDTMKRYDDIWLPLSGEMPFSSMLMSDWRDIKSNDGNVNTRIIEEKNAIQLENLNLLYVATTRAKEQLYIITIQEPSSAKTESTYISTYFHSYCNKNNLVGNQFILHGNAKEKIKKKQTIKEIQTEDISLNSYPWQEKIKISLTSEKIWANSDAITYGNLIHAILSTIKTSDDLPKAIQKAKINELLTLNTINVIEKNIEKIIHHPKLKPYFSKEVIIYNERDFIYNKEIIRPDRLAITKDECVIIDYKTGDVSSRYTQQLDNYAYVLGKIGYTNCRKILVYINEDITLVEWI